MGKVHIFVFCMLALGLASCSSCKDATEKKGAINLLPALHSVDIPRSSYSVATTIPAYVYGVTDPENREVTLTYRWYIDNMPAEGQTNMFLEAGIAGKNAVVKCEVTPNDGRADGIPVFSNEITVGNSAPVLVGGSMSPMPVTFGTKRLTALPGSAFDPDGDELHYRYLWFKGNAQLELPESQNVVEITTKPGDQWAVWIVATDGEATSNLVSVGSLVEQYEAASLNYILNTSARAGIDTRSTGFGFIELHGVSGFDGGVKSTATMMSNRHIFESIFE